METTSNPTTHINFDGTFTIRGRFTVTVACPGSGHHVNSIGVVQILLPAGFDTSGSGGQVEGTDRLDGIREVRCYDLGGDREALHTALTADIDLPWGHTISFTEITEVK
jgi:hypothetical protein